MILDPFLEGMKQAGAEIELFYNYQLNIKPCCGKFACWTNPDGQCIQNDDMATLIPKVAKADLIVYGTPVYLDGMTGSLKTMIDRMIPLGKPFFEIRDDHCRHPKRDFVKRSQVALVSVCGFHELDNFDPLIQHMKAICKNIYAEYTGAILRPHIGAYSQLMNTDLTKDIPKAIENAGYELIQKGKMCQNTLESIQRELIPREQYVDITNDHFQKAIDSKKTKKS